MRTVTLELLTTDHCTLCDAALDLLLQIPQCAGCALRTVDVTTDDALFARYAADVPVLRAQGAELAWPFSADDVVSWLETF